MVDVSVMCDAFDRVDKSTFKSSDEIADRGYLQLTGCTVPARQCCFRSALALKAFWESFLQFRADDRKTSLLQCFMK